MGHEFFLLFKLKLQYFVQESAAKFTIFIFCKKKFFENLVFLTDTVAGLAVRYTLCGRYTLCAHCILIYYSARLGFPKGGGLRFEYERPKTRTKRQATQHGCLPRLLGDGAKRIEIVYGEEKKYFVLGRLEQPRENRNLLYRHDKPNEPTKEGFLSFVLFESPFTPVFQQPAGATPL